MSIKLELPELPESFESYTGETIRIPRLEVPEIRVSYKSEDDPNRVAPRGEFIEYDPATREIKALTKQVSSIQIIHHRQQVSLTKDTETYKGFEINMRSKEYTLLHFTKDASGKSKTRFIGKGTLEHLRSLDIGLAKLRYERCLYVIHEDKLKKLTVYSASFSQFIKFTKQLKGQSTSSVVVNLTTT